MASQKQNNAELSFAAGDSGFLGTIAAALPGIIWIFEPDGHVKFVSERWREFSGSDALPESAQDGRSFIHPEDFASGEAGWRRSIEIGEAFEAEVRLRRPDGTYRWYTIRAVPERNAQNEIQQWVGVGVDIERQKQLAEDSAATHADLNRVNEKLEQTVAERTQQLQQVVEQLEAFAYSIAHDMRAPLRAMHQYAETVSRDFASKVPAEARVYLSKIMVASEKLDSLIREVLVYTRVSQGRIELRPMSLERLLSEVLMVHPQLNSPAVELHARLPLHAVIGDETALTQAFSNLLTNATKFVPNDRKPKVEIWTELKGEKVRICIKDNGIGIPAGDRDRVFKMFERLQPEERFEGSGIGLTIVRRAVERMGGKLGVESEEGVGSTFWMELANGGDLC